MRRRERHWQKMKDIPELSMDTIKRMEDMSWFTHARIFDDLIIVAQKETALYILKTAAGLIVIDGIWPDKRVYEEILRSISEAGWDGEKITMFLMTHGHIDHVGCGKWLKENHRVKTCLSGEDDELRLSAPHEEGRSDSWKEFEIDTALRDGDKIDCGDRGIFALSTPGHTKGTMSFIFPVHENGARHMACLFGGATPPWGNEKGREQQRESVKKFRDAAGRYGCDVALTNHTAFDCGLERIAYSRARLSFLPNIYILGSEGVRDFCSVFDRIAAI